MKLLFYCLAVLCIFSCTSKNNNVKAYSFYHWKSKFVKNSIQEEYLSSLKVDKIYTRYFDVVQTSRGIQPTAITSIDTILSQEIIPVIFIVHESLIHLSKIEIQELAKNIYTKSLSIHPKEKINALQLDCDWTQKSRDNFFLLCKEMKKYVPHIISTIRLHQYKNPKATGIPPVDKGIVMCYATESPLEDVENSILNIELLKQYLDTKKYLLEVDFALPIYSWAVATNHIGKHKLINGISIQDVKDITIFESIGNNQYKVKKNTFLKGNQLSKGFTLRIENISVDLLKKAKEVIENHSLQPYDLVYYHLDEAFLKQYTIEDLK